MPRGIPYDVPFDTVGNLLRNPALLPPDRVVWRPPQQFPATLIFIAQYQTRYKSQHQHPYYIWRDLAGHRFPMFRHDWRTLIRPFDNAQPTRVTGIWGYRRVGTRFGYRYGIRNFGVDL